MSRPASMRLAMAISPSRESSSTLAHLAQIHAHGVVGPSDIGIVQIAAAAFFFFLVAAASRGGRLLGCRGRTFLRLLAIHQVDAHLVEHRHGVLDLLGGHLGLRQGGVQLIMVM